MPTLYYPTTKDFAQGTLGAELLEGVTASATLNTTASTIGVQNKAGVLIVNRIDANGVETPTKVEVISFTGTSGSTVTTLVRGLAGTTDQDHAVGAIVEFGPDIVWAQGLIDTYLVEHNTTGTHKTATVTTLKATGAEINTGTEDAKIVTPKAIADSDVVLKDKSQTLTQKTLTSPVLNTGVTGTAVLDEDDMASDSATKLATQQSIKAYVDAQTGGDMSYSDSRDTITFHSYDMATASGTQSLTGAGFTPKLAQISAIVQGAIAFSNGVSNGTNHYVINTNGNTGIWSRDNTKCIELIITSGNSQVATLAFTSDGGTLTWTKSGTPTGEVYFWVKWSR